MAVGFTKSYILPNTTDGFDTLLVGTASAVPVFVPMLLFFVWCVVFLGGSLAQQRRTGTSDLPIWSTIASISTLMMALPLTLAKGLIGGAGQTITLVVVVMMVILSGLWLLLSQSRGEV